MVEHLSFLQQKLQTYCTVTIALRKLPSLWYGAYQQQESNVHNVRQFYNKKRPLKNLSSLSPHIQHNVLWLHLLKLIWRHHLIGIPKKVDCIFSRNEQLLSPLNPPAAKQVCYIQYEFLSQAVHPQRGMPGYGNIQRTEWQAFLTIRDTALYKVWKIKQVYKRKEEFEI